MPKNEQNFVYSVIILVLLQLLQKCSARSVFAVENNLVGIFNNNNENEIGFFGSHNVVKNNNKPYIEISKATTQPTTNSKMLKKWNMGTRVTRRQYEIINMLWRKTKIFLDQTDAPNQELSSGISEQNNITTNNKFVFSTRLPMVQLTSTPSNIEFYYFNDPNKKEDTNKNGHYASKCKETVTPTRSRSTRKSNPAFVVFHIKGPAIGESKTKWYESQRLQTTIHRSIFITTRNPNFFATGRNFTRRASVSLKKKAYTNTYNTTPNIVITKPVSDKINKKTDISYSTSSTTNDQRPSQDNIYLKIFHNSFVTTEVNKETIAYDKIKFFELYDRMTPIPNFNRKGLFSFDYDEDFKKSNEAPHEKILLSHVDQGSHDHDTAKHSKKHITEDQHKNNNISRSNSKKEIKKTTKYVINTTKFKKNATTHHSIEFERKSLKDDILYTFSNKTAKWSEYPFAAVYVYEPSQIHCDAAGISAHWLVASGSCLSRLNKNLDGEGRSAYVTYCGANWWRPERVSYVKHTLVHPWFHPTDKTRRHVYNIGVIKVVTSMTVCSGWSPIDLMSHQFTTAQGGTLASAVGWGLDRFDTRSSTRMELPKAPLTIYSGLVFSNTCPGNYEYSNAKLFEDNGYLRSLYCLSLPPYFGEEHDPVHGALLLVDGKLIALYLQEERRPWGQQSAQYTGVWRLIPWITDVAKETDDIETSYIEI